MTSSHLINPDSPFGHAFSAYCAGDLAVTELSASARDEYASVARMLLDTPAIAQPAAPEDAPLPAFLADFIGECES